MALFEVNPALVYSILAVLPPAAIFFVAYGRYDGTFRDNVVFLYFTGGVLMGFLVGFLTAAVFTQQVNALLSVLLLAILYPISVTVGINRRKWQGERHAVFNGGAFGIGLALMLGFTLLYVQFRQDAITGERLAQALVLCSSLAGLFFGLGLVSGDSVRRRAPFRGAFTGAAIGLVPIVFLVEFSRSEFNREPLWLWLGLLLAYGLFVAVLAERKLLIEGVSDEARRERRRKRRSRMLE